LKWLHAAADEIVGCTKKSIEDLDMNDVEKLIGLMIGSRDRRIFTVGMGRSGFVARAFALRLMNLGFNVYFLGETITPAAEKGDLLVAISGTGAHKNGSDGRFCD
jgi:6-phospho-3-hexuloisomerase